MKMTEKNYTWNDVKPSDLFILDGRLNYRSNRTTEEVVIGTPTPSYDAFIGVKGQNEYNYKISEGVLTYQRNRAYQRNRDEEYGEFDCINEHDWNINKELAYVPCKQNPSLSRELLELAKKELLMPGHKWNIYYNNKGAKIALGLDENHIKKILSEKDSMILYEDYERILPKISKQQKRIRSEIAGQIEKLLGGIKP